METVEQSEGQASLEVKETKMVTSHGINGETEPHLPVKDACKRQSPPSSPSCHSQEALVNSGTNNSLNINLKESKTSLLDADGDVEPNKSISDQPIEHDCAERLCLSEVTNSEKSDISEKATIENVISKGRCDADILDCAEERDASSTGFGEVLPKGGIASEVCSSDKNIGQVERGNDQVTKAANEAEICAHDPGASSEESKNGGNESEKENIPVADHMKIKEAQSETVSGHFNEEGKQDDSKNCTSGGCIPHVENTKPVFSKLIEERIPQNAESVSMDDGEKGVAEHPTTDDHVKPAVIVKESDADNVRMRTEQPCSEMSSGNSTFQQPLGKTVPDSSATKPVSKMKARKSGQPVRQAPMIIRKDGSTSEPGTIKITNLHPTANITLKLSELEEMLKVKDKCVRPFAGGENAKKDRSSDSGMSRMDTANSVADSVKVEPEDSEPSTSQQSKEVKAKRKLRVKLRKKRRRGTYDFPGKKPQKKKRLSGKEGDDESCFPCNDKLFDPLRHVGRKSIGSPRKQYSVLDLLTKNSHRAFMKRRNTFIRRKCRESPLKGKSIMDMLREKRRTSGDSGTETAGVVHEKMSATGDSSPSILATGDSKNSELLEKQRKRRISAEGVQSSSVREDDSAAIAGKRQKTGDGSDTPPPVLQPVVMVVTKHLPNTPGLRSILPKLSASSTPSSPSSQATPVVVPAGQPILLATSSLLVPGSKVSLVPATLAPGAKATLPLLTSLAPSSAAGVTRGVATLLNFQPKSSHPIAKSSDALRALLTKSASLGKTVSVIPAPLTTAKVVSVPTSTLMTSTTVSAALDKNKVVNKISMSPRSTAKPMSSSSSTTSSSSSLSDPAEAKSSGSLPNGLSLPVTPPKTPEEESNMDGSVSLTTPDSDVVPLCCCKIGGANFSRLSTGATYCQALDSVDGKVLGCCNKVTNTQLVRPGVKIPFMAVCEVHRKRLKMHQCCPGCGHFCTQGKFLQCRREGGSSVHNFHKQCQTVRDTRLFCPHCGEESGQMEVNLTLHEPRPNQSTEQIRANLRKTILKAKMSFPMFKKSTGEAQPGMAVTLPSSKTISTDGLPTGPDKGYLEKLFKLCIAKEERPKKYRVLPKSMYQPASEGDLDKVFYMLMDGMDPNQKCEEQDNQTVMHAAVYSGNLGLVYLLIHSGAALHAPDKSLKTPLMVAAECGYLGIMKLLVTAGARLDDRGEDNMTCLHYAAKAGHLEVIQYILDVSAVDINATDEGGWTPIMWATESQLVEVVRYLVSRGGDPSKKDNEENTGLHWAAYAGSVEITELFMDMGCELDTPNEHGDRPLHIAARQDHYEVVVVLLARGANVDVRNNKDETPIACCLDQNSQVCMALKVNRQLRSFASKLSRPERLLHRDISLGREKNPLPCLNAVDNEPYPTDYLYVNHNVETQDLHINAIITSLQSCRCKDDCSSLYCVCARSSIKCWYDKLGHLMDDFNMVDPPHIFECNRACRCWVNCNNRVVQNGITCRLQVFRTVGRGWGVRSLMDIPKGTFICEYIGELLSDSEADRREDDSYLFDLDNKDGDTYCIDARRYGNVARFINHRCEPNLIPVKVFIEHQDLRFPRICFFSSCDIKAYEELGFDYGEKFWIIKWKQFTCTCGSPKCKYSSETIQRTLAEYRARHEDEETTQET